MALTRRRGRTRGEPRSIASQPANTSIRREGARFPRRKGRSAGQCPLALPLVRGDGIHHPGRIDQCRPGVEGHRHSIGIDRLTMLLTGAESIRDVILFPTMRPER